MAEERKESTLSIIDSSGRQVSLLNDSDTDLHSPSSVYSYSSDDSLSITTSSSDWRILDSEEPARKYHCTEPGCSKSFTTSGHLARHNRIHTGEKNFPCLFPGCQSRFSRQDNMMQHYRTHMAPKSRRAHKPSSSAVMKEEVPLAKPRLHAHHRIRSDPYRVEAPLTISQHLANYHHRSLATKDTSFFQHRPINPTPAGQAPSFVSTLLHPTPPTDCSKAVCESPKS